MNYLIIGTGGVGGCIAGFLALAGKDVTCIARGKHLEAIRRQGLHLKSDLKGEHFLRVKACTAEEYQGKADVIGKIDMSKVNAIAFDPYTHGYYKVTERVGEAFRDGLKLKK